MICFICKKQFPSVEALVLHLKIYHSLSSYSTFQCIEESCSQLFSNIHSFKRHINNHKIKTLVENVVPIETIECIETDSNTEESMMISNNCMELSTDFSTTAAEFSISLHNYNNFTRKNVENVQKLVANSFLTPIASELKYFCDHISSYEAKFRLQQLIENISTSFDSCKTDYLMNKWLKHNGYLEELIQFSIDESVGVVMHNGEVAYDEEKTKGVLLPIKFQFKKYFEKTNVLKNTLNILKESDEVKDGYYNFTHGKLWKEKVAKYDPNEICIPFFLYFDDFEINNNLGSHCESVCGIYYSFPLSNTCSKLDRIFVAGFIKSQDLKEFGNDASLKYLISQLNEMENDGVILNTEDGCVKARFILGLILGDNLGLNSILGFSRSFSSTFFCRFCKTPKKKTHTMILEEHSYLRNIKNYEDDTENNCVAETGIIENSPLNRLISFHVIDNFAVDMMHDIFEGICHYDICHIIKHYTEKVKLFSLDELNLRKQSFNYASLEIDNISNPIREHHLKNNHLKMTASEMKCFIRLFPLIIGDIIPENDSVWEFFLILLKIISLLLKKFLSKNDISLLRQLIADHNEKYVVLFSDTLKPKHHLLIHYPTIIENSGPPKHFWCFRFEAKHKDIKVYAHVTSSRQNILLTLAKKYQLKFSHFLMSPEQEEFTFDEKHAFYSDNSINIFSKLQIKPQKSISLTQIEYKGTIYRKGYILTKFYRSLCVFEIIEICVLQETSEVILLMNELLVNSYNPHYDAYEIDSQKAIISRNLAFNIKEFNVKPLNLHYTIKGKLMIRLKEYF